jgi:hypothetical protein
MGLLCDYFSMLGRRSGNHSLKMTAEELRKEFIDPRMDLAYKAKNERTAVKDEEDYSWVGNMAPAEEVRVAVMDMMRDLATAAYAQQQRMTGALWKDIATICETGILFLAQCNSRPGPWENLTIETIDDMEQKGKDFWTAVVGHKQLGIRGAHGCFMCESSIKATRVYVGMEGRTDESSVWLYKNKRIADWLKSACRVYLPGRSEMTPTGMRCFWETKMHHDEGELCNFRLGSLGNHNLT